jgi:hypothetical protein
LVRRAGHPEESPVLTQEAPSVSGRAPIGDVYRALTRGDCDAVARHYNRNLASDDPLWCAGGQPYDGARVWLHCLTLRVRGQGRLISQVHERDGRVLSYFGGYRRRDEARFSIGVVDLELPDPRNTWRRDVGHMFGEALATGTRAFTIRASSDHAWFVGWMEDEVGMRRDGERRVWTADRACMAGYVDSLDSAGAVTREKPTIGG